MDSSVRRCNCCYILCCHQRVSSPFHYQIRILYIFAASPTEVFFWVIGTTKLYLRTSRKTGWWRPKNCSTGSWNSPVSRFVTLFLSLSSWRGLQRKGFCSLMQKTSIMLFLNKFDIFEKKVLDVRAEEYSHLCKQDFWFLLTNAFFFFHSMFIGSVECLRVVQRLPTSF